MTGSAKSLTYVGAGVIGNHAVPALARSGCVGHVTLVDPDEYEPRNLASQDITPGDVGRPKVEVLAARVRRINPSLRVQAIAEHVERVPLGRLRADLIATGVDNLAARRWVNRLARRLGMPWVDAGVRAEGLLVRVDVFEPVSGAACMECAWSENERAELDNHYPCDPPAAPPPTRAPAYLGALAAALQCAECSKLLAGEALHALLGRQLLLEATTHRQYVSARRCSPECAFDHRRWSIRPLAHRPGEITLGRALRLLPSRDGAPTRLRVHGDVFVHRLACPECHASREVLRLGARIDDVRICPRCGAAMVAPGIGITDTLVLARLGDRQRRVSLHALGLRAGDVFTIEAATCEAHFEIGGR